MSGSRFYLFVGQYEPGRYSKAHKHTSEAVLICLKGKGYTYTWPETAGKQPWVEGNSMQVKRQDYEFGGMVSAAPMSGDWFHQHFGVSEGPLRLTAWFGPNNDRPRKPGLPGEPLSDRGAIDMKKGGDAIPYDEEDPFLRQEYENALEEAGIKSKMKDSWYRGEVYGETFEGP
jgi:hypothetical protein